MSEIQLVHFQVYIPHFNTETDKYADISPYRPYERQPIRYECRCRAGASFCGTGQFKQHIKSKTHQDFITNYSKYFKEVDEAQDKIKQLTVENEMLQRKINRQQEKINHLILCLDEENDNDMFQDCE